MYEYLKSLKPEERLKISCKLSEIAIRLGIGGEYSIEQLIDRLVELGEMEAVAEVREIIQHKVM